MIDFSRLLSLLFLTSWLLACTEEPTKQHHNAMNAWAYLQAAQQHAHLDNQDSSLYFLSRSFAYGHPDPMEIIRDPDLRRLIDNPEYRPKMRDLLQQYAAGKHTVMVSPEESGERILIRGKIIDQRSEEPIRGVAIELVQADASGLYFHEKNSLFNPRIFAYLRSDSTGLFSVETIRPATYPEDGGEYATPHMHFNLSHKKYRPFNSEFLFTDDTLFQMNGNPEGLPEATLTNRESLKVYTVNIPMQRE